MTRRMMHFSLFSYRYVIQDVKGDFYRGAITFMNYTTENCGSSSILTIQMKFSRELFSYKTLERTNAAKVLSATDDTNNSSSKSHIGKYRRRHMLPIRSSSSDKNFDSVSKNHSIHVTLISTWEKRGVCFYTTISSF